MNILNSRSINKMFNTIIEVTSLSKWNTSKIVIIQEFSNN